MLVQCGGEGKNRPQQLPGRVQGGKRAGRQERLAGVWVRRVGGAARGLGEAERAASEAEAVRAETVLKPAEQTAAERDGDTGGVQVDTVLGRGVVTEDQDTQTTCTEQVSSPEQAL